MEMRQLETLNQQALLLPDTFSGPLKHSRFISYFRKVNPLSTSSLGRVTLGRVLQIPNLKWIPWMEQLRGSASEFGGFVQELFLSIFVTCPLHQVTP